MLIYKRNFFSPNRCLGSGFLNWLYHKYGVPSLQLLSKIFYDILSCEDLCSVNLVSVNWVADLLARGRCCSWIVAFYVYINCVQISDLTRCFPFSTRRRTLHSNLLSFGHLAASQLSFECSFFLIIVYNSIENSPVNLWNRAFITARKITLPLKP